MNKLRLGVIVEGQGDQLALPPLVRRLLHHAGLYFDVKISQPFRVKRGRFSPKFSDFENALVFLSAEHEAILVVLDADDECPVTLASNLRQRATKCVSHRDVRIVVANKEFEAWFLAGADSLSGSHGIRQGSTCPADAESIRSAKQRVEDMIETGIYSETVDQVKLACAIDIDETRSRSPSFDKLVREVISLSPPS